MKIAIITTMGSSPWGGSEYLWAELAKQALIEKNEVLISLYDWSVTHPIVKELQLFGAQLFPRPKSIKKNFFSNFSKKILNKIRINFYLEKSSYSKIFDYKPDIVYISQGGSYEIVYNQDLLHDLMTNEIPFIFICQLNYDSSPIGINEKKIISKIFERAKLVAFVSEHNRKSAERHLGRRLGNSVVVRNPLNLADKNLVPFPALTKISFASVARLEVAYKGQDVLFETLSCDVWKARNWQLCLYGSGPDQEYLKALTKFYDLEKGVVFCGHINNVRSIWETNQILVLPSRAEGTPLALVEAMICGRPAVVSDVGGNKEWIEDGVTGFVAEAPTSYSFGIALEKAWQQKNKWEKMGECANQYAKQHIDETPGHTLLRLQD